MSGRGGAGVPVVGVAVVADRVGVLVRADAATPDGAGARLWGDPVMVTRRGTDVAGWVAASVTAVRLAVLAGAVPAGTPPVALLRPLPGRAFEWHPLITGALLASGGLKVVLVGARWVNRACQQRLAAADGADPERPDPERDPAGFTRWRGGHPLWRRGYPPALIGPREQAGGGVRQVWRAAWDVAGGAGLWLAEQGGELR